MICMLPFIDALLYKNDGCIQGHSSHTLPYIVDCYRTSYSIPQ